MFSFLLQDCIGEPPQTIVVQITASPKGLLTDLENDCLLGTKKPETTTDIARLKKENKM